MDNTQKLPQKSIPCPECDTPLQIPEDVSPGKIVECPACGTESEFVDLNPLKISPLEEEK